MRCLFFFTLRYNYLFQPYPTILFGRPQDASRCDNFWEDD